MSGLRQVLSCPGPANPTFGKRPQTRKIHFGLEGFCTFMGFLNICKSLLSISIYMKFEVLIVVLLKIPDFWDVPVCHWMNGSWYLEGSQGLQNIRNYSPNDTASHSKRLESLSEYTFMHHMRFELLMPSTTKGRGTVQFCKQVHTSIGMSPQADTMEAVVIIFTQLVK